MHTASESENQVKSEILLYVVIRQISAILPVKIKPCWSGEIISLSWIFAFTLLMVSDNVSSNVMVLPVFHEDLHTFPKSKYQM